MNDKVTELLQSMRAELKEYMATDEGWAAWLTKAAMLHQYSAGNVTLMLSQRRTVSTVMGYKAWQKAGRQVKVGEKGLAILAPMVKKEQDEKGTDRVVATWYRIVYVFDVEQTEGEPFLPTKRMDTASHPEALATLWAYAEGKGLEVQLADTGAAGGYITKERIVLSDQVEVDQRLRTLVHELAHHELGHVGDPCKTGALKELEAESVAYVVASILGLPAKDFSLPYLAAWAGERAEYYGEALKAGSAESIIRVTRVLLGVLGAAE